MATPPNAMPWAYGLLGVPLAFGALPLYVALPHHYAQYPGMDLRTLGVTVLLARVLDAVVDPAVGRWSDALLRHSERRTWALACVGGVALAGSFAALWQVPEGISPWLWLMAMLPLCTLACSSLTIVHQAWGTRWAGSPLWRARIAAWREGAALLGVIFASALIGLQHSLWLSLGLAVGLVLGLLGLRRTFGWLSQDEAPVAADRPAGPGGAHRPAPLRPSWLAPWLMPWQKPAFRRLIAVHLLNGVAAAIPATLLPFFVADRLQAPAMQGVFLLGYFGAAALAMPLWLRLIARRGLAPTWRLGMACTVLAFALTPLLQPGDVWPFFAICVASGTALGADLAVPGALLTGVVHGHGQEAAPASAARHAGLHAGWWAFSGKLSLALAAGLSLPLLQAWGYQSGSRDAAAVQALVLAYAGLPCVLKLLAAATLWWSEKQHPEWSACA